MKKLVYLGLTLGAFALGCEEDPCDEVGYGNEIGQCIENITLPDKNDKEISLNPKGYTTLLVQSAGFCGPCNDEADRLPILLDAYENKDFQIYEIMMYDWFGNEVQPYFLEQWEEVHPGLSNVVGDYFEFDEERNFDLPTTFYLFDGSEELAIPHNIIINKDGIIKYKTTGFPEGEIRRELEWYLNQE